MFTSSRKVQFFTKLKRTKVVRVDEDQKRTAIICYFFIVTSNSTVAFLRRQSSSECRGQKMNRSMKLFGVVVLSIAAFLAGAALSSAEDQPAPRIKVVPLDPGDQSYFLLLHGPPETKSFRSGLVTLAPGTSIGVHNSGTNEEMLVPLEGQGELRFSDHPPVLIKPGLITYAPAHSEHDVINTGSVPLRYIFITAKAE
jgi:mannose-6-phosphate isomerase-like protein (cupin superfamily)